MILNSNLRNKLKVLLPNNDVANNKSIKDIFLELAKKTDETIANIPTGGSTEILRQEKHPTTLNVGEYYYNTELKKILFLKEKNPWAKPKYKITPLVTDLTEAPFRIKINFLSPIRKNFCIKFLDGLGNDTGLILTTDTTEIIASKINSYTACRVESFTENSIILTCSLNRSLIMYSEFTTYMKENIFQNNFIPLFSMQDGVDYSIEILDRGFWKNASSGALIFNFSMKERPYSSYVIQDEKEQLDLNTATRYSNCNTIQEILEDINNDFNSLMNTGVSTDGYRLANAWGKVYNSSINDGSIFIESEAFGPDTLSIYQNIETLSQGLPFIIDRIVVGGDIWVDTEGNKVVSSKYYV